MIVKYCISQNKDRLLFNFPITFVRNAVYENLAALPIQMYTELSPYPFMWMHQRTLEVKNCWLYIRNERCMKVLLLEPKNTFLFQNGGINCIALERGFGTSTLNVAIVVQKLTFHKFVMHFIRNSVCFHLLTSGRFFC